MNANISSETSGNKGFGKIRIMRVPDGEAPYEIRRQWIGLELECAYFDRAAWIKRNFSKKPPLPLAGYWVNQDHAILMLRQKDPATADWWNTEGYPHTDESVWFFDSGCAEVLIRPQSKHEILCENN